MAPWQVLGCAVVRDIGCTELGKRCVELTAFCIHPSARGAGRGDSLLDYLEQARSSLWWSPDYARLCLSVRLSSRKAWSLLDASKLYDRQDTPSPPRRPP